jgi:hypothetical protein
MRQFPDRARKRQDGLARVAIQTEIRCDFAVLNR